MATMNVFDYRVHWNIQENQGQLDLHGHSSEGGRYGMDATHSIPVDSASEMLLLVDLLRNEKPIWLDVYTKKLYTGAAEPVGEGEGN